MAFLSLPGAEIFHQQAGSGQPAIVLVHGGMCDHRDWDSLVPLLADRHTVVGLDLRGHGYSTGDAANCSIELWAKDLVALVDALGLSRPVLVGHSLASRIVAQAAALAPDKVGAVVLLDGSRSHGGYAAEHPAGPSPPTVEGLAAGGLAAIIDATIGPYADATVRAAVQQTMAAAPPAVMAACAAAMRDWDLGHADMVFPRLAGGLPVLAIQTTYHDQATPRRSIENPGETTLYLDFLRATVTQLEFAVLVRTGHFAMREQPGPVAALIHAFASKARID